MITLKQLTLKNIRAFIQGYSRSLLLNFYQKKLEHIFEQVEYRIDQVAEKSPQCLLDGECRICHCKIPELFYADKACSNKEDPCYTEMLSKPDWIKFKILNNVD